MMPPNSIFQHHIRRMGEAGSLAGLSPTQVITEDEEAVLSPFSQFLAGLLVIPSS
jgi:hypothetical protein